MRTITQIKSKKKGAEITHFIIHTALVVEEKLLYFQNICHERHFKYKFATEKHPHFLAVLF